MSHRIIPGGYWRNLARDYNGSSHQSVCSSALGLGPDSSKSFGGWFRVDSYAAQRVLGSIGISGAGTSRVFLSTAITTGNVTITTTDAGVGSSSASVSGVAVGNWFLAIGYVPEGNTGRSVSCNFGARGTEGTTRSTTMPPNTVRIGATPGGTAFLDGQCAAFWVVRGELSEAQQHELALGAHITEVADPTTLLDAWDMTRVGPVRGQRGYMMDAVAGGPLLLGPPGIQQAPRLVRVYVGLVAGGTDYTLACDSVAYTTTATSASLLAHRKVDAATVGYTWAPTAAALLKASRVAADSVPSAWSPTSATLLKAYRLAVDSVAYSWSPTSAALLYARRLVADSVSYVWTPSDATLVKLGDYDLIADTVPFAWAPTAATLTTARRLACESVSFAATATDASLTAARRLDAGTVTYAWQPTAAALVTGRTLAADAVAFMWTPTDAALRSDRVLSVDSASYVWTPTAADLDYSGEVEPPTYTVLRIGAARAGRTSITARAGRSSLTARTHLSE
jgi:hypothetical protein